MKRLLWWVPLFFMLGCLRADEGIPYPDKALTPGGVNPALTKDVICAATFRTGVYRHVSLQEKKTVFERYGIPWNDHAKYEVDHLISLELGGSNEIENLWPEAYEPRPGAHEKDVVENSLHQDVCAGRVTLEEAQKEIVEDWFKAYQGAK